jgi:hypothetical protein
MEHGSSSIPFLKNKELNSDVASILEPNYSLVFFFCNSQGFLGTEKTLAIIKKIGVGFFFLLQPKEVLFNSYFFCYSLAPFFSSYSQASFKTKVSSNGAKKNAKIRPSSKLGVGPTLGLFLFCHLNFSQH